MPFTQSGTDQTITQLGESFSTDRFGVDTIQLIVRIPDNLFPQQVLADYAPHPRFGNMLLSKRDGQRGDPGYWNVTYTFEGFLDEEPEEPTYELVGSLSQEPIETHPDFATVIAGTPASPKNGAIFVDPESRKQSEATNAVFKEFSNNPDPGKKTKARVDSYLEPSVEWRETKFQRTRPNSVTSLGNIQEPAGSPPTLSPRDWIVWSYSYVRRGALYQVTTTWRMSGRNGWDPDIYDTE
jgi:hypothetical protein